MEEDKPDTSKTAEKVVTSGIDAAIVAGLFLILFLTRTFMFRGAGFGYVVGGLTVDAIIFAIGYQIAKRITNSIQTFRILYIVIFALLIYFTLGSKR